MRMFGREALLRRIHDLQAAGQHVSVVGPRSIGKTLLLKRLVEDQAGGSDLFTMAGYLDLRHNPPGTYEAALKRIGSALRDLLTNSGGEFKYLAGEIALDGTAEELYDSLKIAVELLDEGDQRVLLVLDGCDPVLQNPAIPRNLWDNLRTLAQVKSLKLVTGSRDRLNELCYNPEARTSDFFRIFYDEPLVVGPFDDSDWEALFEAAPWEFDVPARKELVNWTGGHPDLVGLLLERLEASVAKGGVGKTGVDAAAEALLIGPSSRLEALWRGCPDQTKSDIEALTKGELLANEIPTDRLRFLTDRGLARRAGNKLRLSNRMINRLASTRSVDVAGVRKLFGSAEDFAANIRTVLELRLAQMPSCDGKLRKYVKRSIDHLPDDPEGAVGSARDLFDRATQLIWEAECPGDKVPSDWIDAWKYSGRTNRLVDTFGKDPTIPEPRGLQCNLLRTATGQQRLKPVTKYVTKRTYVLVEHMSQIGDLRNHSGGEPSLTMAAAFCLAAVELVEVLTEELASAK